jgi:hypothetical protein
MLRYNYESLSALRHSSKFPTLTYINTTIIKVHPIFTPTSQFKSNFKMSQDVRGRSFQQQIDNQSKIFTALVKLMKKLVKTEDSIKSTKVLFQSKWNEIASTERSPGLKTVFARYS